MKCPQCQSEDVEYENCNISEWDLVKVVNKIPGAIYQCLNCSCDFEWIKGQKLRVISDGVDQLQFET